MSYNFVLKIIKKTKKILNTALSTQLWVSFKFNGPNDTQNVKYFIEKRKRKIIK